MDKFDLVVEKVEKVSYEDGKYIVILTVEDLDINSSYTVKAEGIEDEFGNVLEKNNTATISVGRDKIAAATVNGHDSSNGNKIEIRFTKPLDKASAEDIGKYSINGGIGTPIDAEYKNKVVTLKTAKMVNAKEYEIKIKGVEDLAGNILDLKFKFNAKEGEEDTTAPELVSVYTVNKRIVAALFDEKVEFETGTKLYLVHGDDPAIGLVAKARSEDDRIVEFSSAEDLTEDIYQIVMEDSFLVDKDNKDTVGIKDLAGNKLDLEALEGEEILVYGNDIEVEAPEVLSIYQKTVKLFEMVMSKEVAKK